VGLDFDLVVTLDLNRISYDPRAGGSVADGDEIDGPLKFWLRGGEIPLEGGQTDL